MTEKLGVENNQLRADWERRAIDKGSSYSGVLFRNLPDILNYYLHERHILIVLTKLLPLLPKHAALLDIGCGYGRISSYIRTFRPDIKLIGVDFAFPYCKQYFNNVGFTPVCADFSRPPFTQFCVDGLIAVTALMYVSPSDREKVITVLVNLLKPKGVALFIDSGKEFFKVASIIKSCDAKSSTSGTGFILKEYNRLGKSTLTEIVDCGGFTGFSLLLPILHLFRAQLKVMKHLLKLSTAIDESLGHWRCWQRFALHRWMLLKRTR